MSHHTILVSFALICAIGYASGTTCYECSSVYDSGCSNDRFSRLGKSTASDCNYCQKVSDALDFANKAGSHSDTARKHLPRNTTYKMTYNILLATTTLLCAIGYANGVICYSCSSLNDNGCASGNFNPLGVSTVDNCAVCQNVYTEAYILSTTTRACATTCTESNVNVAGMKTITTCCSSALCNSAIYFRASYGILPAAVMLTIATYSFR